MSASAPLRHVAAASWLAALALTTPAQQAPLFLDGELIVNKVAPSQALYRVDPVTGKSLLLYGGLNTHHLGSMTYDPYRRGLLISAGFTELDGPFVYHLGLIDGAGELTDLGFAFQQFRAMHAVGDGRVYFQRNELHPPHEIEVLDAAGQVHVLVDSTTSLPVDLHAGFSFFSPESNALFVASAASCAGPGDARVFRLPLSPDGLGVVGPITCAAWDFPSQSEYVNGLDRLPDGDLLMAVSHSFVGNETLVRIDADTGALSLWARTKQSDLNGVVWSQRIGRAVVVDDFFNDLKMFDEDDDGQGADEFGDVLPTDVSFGDPSTGYAWLSVMIDVDLGASAALTADVPAISASAGGSQTLSVAMGSSHAFEIYWVLGSASGWTPGFASGGHVVPLNLDAYSLFTIQYPNTPLLTSSLGVLSAAGTAQSVLTLPPGTTLAGVSLWHTAVAIDSGFTATRVSNAVAVSVLP